MCLEDLESEEENEKDLSHKDLDDLLCEEDTKFKETKEAEILRKKTSKIEEDYITSTIPADVSKSNFRESIRRSITNFREAEKSKSIIDSKINQVKTSSLPKSIENTSILNKESEMEFYDEKVESI